MGPKSRSRPQFETRSREPSKAVRHGRYQQLRSEAEHTGQGQVMDMFLGDRCGAVGKHARTADESAPRLTGASDSTPYISWSRAVCPNYHLVIVCNFE